MRRLKRMTGVTLLEIMLVLAVASLVVVMSIRYYQSAQSSLSTQTMERTIMAIIASTDNIISNRGGDTSQAIEAKDIVAGLPKDVQSGADAVKTPWGVATIAYVTGAGSYTITLTGTFPASALPALKVFLKNLSNFNASTAEESAITLKYSAAGSST